MEDLALNRRLEETRELHTRWSQFHDFFTMALKGESAGAEAEMRFLDLKTRICMLHDGFMQSLKHDQKVGQQVLGILGQCILLRRIPLMNGAEIQKLELDWNEAYMLMNETIAALDEERRRLANVNESTYRIQKAREKVMAQIHNVLTNTLFRVAFFLILIPAFVIVGIPMMGIYNYRDLPDDVPALAPMVKKAEGFWRDKIDPSLEYRSIVDIPVTPITTTVHKEDTSNTKAFTKDAVVSQLFNLGFARDDIEDAKILVQGLSEIIGDARIMTQSRNRKKMLAYIMLFPNNTEADKFIDLRQKGMLAKSEAQRSQANLLINICRKSNLIVIVVSEEPELRDNYPTQKWGFTPEQMHLANGGAAPPAPAATP